jgi:hypothetical protein
MAYKMQKSEVRLLIAFSVTLFVLANVWGWTYLGDKWHKRNQEHSRLSGDEKRFTMLQAQIPLASEYEENLVGLLRTYPSINDRDNFLGNMVERAAQESGVTLSKNGATPTEGLEPDKQGVMPAFIKTGYQAEVTGEWAKVLEFAHKLDDTREFRWTKEATFSVRKSEVEGQDSSLVLNFKLQKWWHPDSERLLAKQNTEDSPPPAAEPNPSAPVPTVGNAEPAVPTAVENPTAQNVAAGEQP